MVPCGVFYDDFPLFSPSELASDADSCVSELLDLLGWKHARTGPKGLPFEPVFQVLGCTLNLERVSAGVVTLENKPGRVDRILEKLSMVETEGRISLHDAQVLHGLMRYACGFFAGRLLQQVCGEVLSVGEPRAQVVYFCCEGFLVPMPNRSLLTVVLGRFQLGMRGDLYFDLHRWCLGRWSCWYRCSHY